MKRVIYFVSAAILLVGVTTYSQQPPAGQKIGLATSLQNGYAGIKRNFTAAAEKMPEADYSFKPGSTPEARTYAQVIAHIAQAQFGQCSGIKGVPNPMAGQAPRAGTEDESRSDQGARRLVRALRRPVRASDRRERDRDGEGRGRTK